MISESVNDRNDGGILKRQNPATTAETARAEYWERRAVTYKTQLDRLNAEALKLADALATLADATPRHSAAILGRAANNYRAARAQAVRS